METFETAKHFYDARDVINLSLLSYRYRIKGTILETHIRYVMEYLHYVHFIIRFFRVRSV